MYSLFYAHHKERRWGMEQAALTFIARASTQWSVLIVSKLWSQQRRGVGERRNDGGCAAMRRPRGWGRQTSPFGWETRTRGCKACDCRLFEQQLRCERGRRGGGCQGCGLCSAFGRWLGSDDLGGAVSTSMYQDKETRVM